MPRLPEMGPLPPRISKEQVSESIITRVFYEETEALVREAVRDRVRNRMVAGHKLQEAIWERVQEVVTEDLVTKLVEQYTKES